MSIKGTQTEKNLLKSFAGESQARNRYDYFAKEAKKEGYVLVSQVFAETALQEMQHAKRFFRFLEGGEVEITACYPAGKIGTTLENLKASACGENEEWTKLYPEFARVAREEGFAAIAMVYEKIAVAEKNHEERYKTLIEHIEKGDMFKKDQPVKWRCLQCGYIHEGPTPPEKCPACGHSASYFECMNEKKL